jgi:hypothetical protein
MGYTPRLARAEGCCWGLKCLPRNAELRPTPLAECIKLHSCLGKMQLYCLVEQLRLFFLSRVRRFHRLEQPGVDIPRPRAAKQLDCGFIGGEDLRLGIMPGTRYGAFAVIPGR